jgi:hypothetical protein
MVARTVGIELPKDFPEVAYNDIADHVGPHQPTYPNPA